MYAPTNPLEAEKPKNLLKFKKKNALEVLFAPVYGLCMGWTLEQLQKYVKNSP
jgi:hypothetical protein